jgi:hypothetical protein
VVCGAWFGVAFLKRKATSDPFRRLYVSENARPRRPTLRSSLVYAASKEIPNRFQLCQTISKAARVLHLASNPTESTINRVLQNISHPASELEVESAKAAL